MVMVGKADGAHTGRRQVERDRRAEGAHAHDEHARLQQLLLAGGPDLGEREMASVSLSLLRRQGPLRHQLPRGLAGTA